MAQGTSPPPRHHCNFKRLSPKNDSQPQPRWIRQREWHTRIVADLVRLCTLRCTCTPLTCVCRCRNVVASATDKKIVACVCECRAHTQSVSVAGLQEQILNQTTHNPVYATLVMLREVAGLPPPPPPPPLITLQGTLLDSTHTHVHTT